MEDPATVSIFGDSLTAGRLGIGYCRFLPFRYSKQGRSGWTCSAIIAMAIEFLRRHPRKHPGAIILQAGANDLLIPHMMRIDSSWASYGLQILDPQHPPLEDDDTYQNVLEDLFHDLTECCGEEMFICSLPLLGEDLCSPLNQKRMKRDELTKKLAMEHGIGWCDLATALLKKYEEISSAYSAPGYADYLLGTPVSLAVDMSSIAGDEQEAWRISWERGLKVTIDGVHPNGHGARAIAAAIRSTLNSSMVE